jgi:hypothetical protein
MDELPVGDALMVPSGIVDLDGVPLLDSVAGVPRVGSELIDGTVQRTTEPRLLSTSPRGPLNLYDRHRGGTVVLAQASGLWTCGTQLAGVETNPEVLSPRYRTRVNASYSGSTGTRPVANDLVTGSTGAWVSRLVSINHVGPGGTVVLSQFSGTAAGAGAEVLTGPIGTLTGVDVGTFLGSTTGYGDTTGKKAPRFSTGPTCYYNCLGVAQEEQVGTSLYRFPLDPWGYNQSFELPRGEFADGAVLEITCSGVMVNTTPDNPLLYFTLNIDEPIWITTGLDAANKRARMMFVSPAMPTISSETPFMATIRLQAARKLDRSQGLIGMLRLELSTAAYSGGGWGSPASGYVVGRQRGSDNIVDAAHTGWDLEDGDDLTNKRSKRNVGVWMAIGPGVATSGVAYCNVHAFIAKLTRGAK